jgi:hypothetical protein
MQRSEVLIRSLDRLAGEQRGWDGDADHRRGLEVDDEFELGGKLNWQMGDGGAFELFRPAGGCLAPKVDK